MSQRDGFDFVDASRAAGLLNNFNDLACSGDIYDSCDEKDKKMNRCLSLAGTIYGKEDALKEKKDFLSEAKDSKKMSFEDIKASLALLNIGLVKDINKAIDDFKKNCKDFLKEPKEFKDYLEKIAELSFEKL